MIGVILCSHASFAQGLYEAAEMITGETENITVLPFVDGDNVDDLVERMRTAAEGYRAQGLPYVYMVDLWGASPFLSLIDIRRCRRIERFESRG